jgi:hypothetical protein
VRRQGTGGIAAALAPLDTAALLMGPPLPPALQQQQPPSSCVHRTSCATSIAATGAGVRPQSASSFPSSFHAPKASASVSPPPPAPTNPWALSPFKSREGLIQGLSVTRRWQAQQLLQGAGGEGGSGRRLLHHQDDDEEEEEEVVVSIKRGAESDLGLSLSLALSLSAAATNNNSAAAGNASMLLPPGLPVSVRVAGVHAVGEEGEQQQQQQHQEEAEAVDGQRHGHGRHQFGDAGGTDGGLGLSTQEGGGGGALAAAAAAAGGGGVGGGGGSRPSTNEAILLPMDYSGMKVKRQRTPKT